MASDPEWDSTHLEEVNALLCWIHSLSFPNAEEVDIKSLRCGGPFASILRIVDCNFFDDEWVAQIGKYNEDSNWRLKETSLRKVYKRLDEYLRETGWDFNPEKWNINFEQIARPEGGLNGILHLLQLTVGVAFLSPNNSIFVANVNGLSSPVQHAIRNATVEVQKCFRDIQSPKPLTPLTDHDDSIPSLSLSTPNHSTNHSVAHNINHSFHYESEEKMKSLSEELDSMKGQIEEKDEAMRRMERKMGELQEKKTEEMRDLKQKLLDRENAYSELEYEKTVANEESRRLKDEIGELRTRLSESTRVEEDRFRREKSDLADEVLHLREKNEQLENRMRDYKEMMNQLKIEEQKNMAYREQLSELESGKETVKNMKQNIGGLQLTLEENHREIELLKAERDQAVSDRLELSEKLSVIEDEKRQLNVNLRRVQEQWSNGNGLERKPSLVEELACVVPDSRYIDDLKRELKAVKDHNVELESRVSRFSGAEEEVRELMSKCAEMTNGAMKMKKDQKEVEEKDLRIRELTVALDRMKVQHEQETRLMTSAVYEMGRQRLSSGLSPSDQSSTERSGTSSSRSFFRRQTQDNAFNLSVFHSLAWLMIALLVVVGVVLCQPLSISDALIHYTNRRQAPLYV
ncbi:hypothetical protein PFISCL1PPCAC_5721 [Pristionchus fissidentatus]|uniref:HOOK N-terminal domain-containing protein n=1 Tax=Pristionchus fissidentatus TaxID=1538716 RepID=A0AAV5V937_9BILA|nr:hypothetical protein PFISCL1PPCAC_5721 [Pristionchus fissidentatus]